MRGSSLDNLNQPARVFGRGSLSIAAEATPGLISHRIEGSAIDDNEDVAVRELSNLQGADFISSGDHVPIASSILDRDRPGESQTLSVWSQQVIVGDSGAKFTTIEPALLQSATEDHSFDYRTVDGSVLAGIDDTPIAGAVTIRSIGRRPKKASRRRQHGELPVRRTLRGPAVRGRLFPDANSASLFNSVNAHC